MTETSAPTTATPPQPDTPAIPIAEPAQDRAEASAAPSAPTPAPPLSAAELDALQTRAAKADQHWDLYVRARADLDNYRKRAQRERQDAVRFASQGLLEKLLPVLDSFDMALAAAAAAPDAAASLREGITMVHGQLKAALAAAGVQEINATGEAFDPNLHEAVARVPTTEVPEGQVVQQLRKGYRLHDRLLRPASVTVAHPPSPDA